MRYPTKLGLTAGIGAMTIDLSGFLSALARKMGTGTRPHPFLGWKAVGKWAGSQSPFSSAVLSRENRSDMSG
jgi:hypothetical protein